MKKHVKLSLTIAFCLVGISVCLNSCGGKSNSIKEDEYNARMDSLTQVNGELNEFIDALAFSIDTITAQEEMLINVVNPETGKTATKEQIRQELDFLQNLIKDQKSKISELENKLKSNETANSKKLQKIIQSYEQQLKEKEARIAELEAQLLQKDMDIQTLTSNVIDLQGKVKESESVISSQTEVIESQNEKINEAYVIAGTKKELQQMGVLTSSGLFKKAKVDISNLSADKFDKVDIRYFTEMPISGKKPKILSQMPEGSYRIEKDGKDDYVIKILNPQAFWSVSNFLIIQY